MHEISAVMGIPATKARNCLRHARSIRVRLAILALVLPWTVLASVAETTFAPVSARESAVIQARSGDPKSALVVLKNLVRNFPNDPRLLADATVVANWAGEDAYVLELYSHPETPKDDEGVVEAAARSARNQHMYGLALDLFIQAERLVPDRWQPRLGHGMVLLDQGHDKDAAALIKPLLEKNGSEPDIMRGRAYLCERQQDFACSIAMYQKLAAINPGKSAELRCQMGQSLSQLGGNARAQEMCDPPDSAAKLRLIAKGGAERVRW